MPVEIHRRSATEHRPAQRRVGGGSVGTGADQIVNGIEGCGDEARIVRSGQKAGAQAAKRLISTRFRDASEFHRKAGQFGHRVELAQSHIRV